MFYYCEKCANIKNISLKDNKDVQCDLCGTAMNPVPKEYLMSNGCFFKSQVIREQFIASIKEKDSYDADLGDQKAELQKIKEQREQEHISAINKKMEQEQFKMTCPICGSQSVQKISAIGKYAKVGLFGILGAGDLGKTWKCQVCGCKF